MCTTEIGRLALKYKDLSAKGVKLVRTWYQLTSQVPIQVAIQCSLAQSSAKQGILRSHAMLLCDPMTQLESLFALYF